MHSTFNPSLMTQQQLEATLVDRSKTVGRVYDLLKIGAETQSKHHVLLVGPRGIGKSHLTTLIYYRLQATEGLEDKLAIALLREDEWGLTSVLDLLIRIYETLQPSEALSVLPLKNGLIGKPPEDSEQIVWQSIQDLLGGRSLLVIAENLDTILGNIGIVGQARLRALIQTHPVWNILATSTTIPSDLSSQLSPFYGFFDLIRIEELTVNGAITLLRRLASSRGDVETESFIASPIGRARVRAIQHLAGGNSRIFVLFYDLLNKRAATATLDKDIFESLQKTIDTLTPYYQSKMASLSPLQQKIIFYLCQRRVPVTVTSIANHCLSSHQTIASQLKQLLSHRYVRVNRLGRESYYELAEPLMRICIEAKSHDREPLRVLVEFLRYWFYRDELEDQLKSGDAPGEMRAHLVAALKEYDSTDSHYHLNEEIARLCVALSNAPSGQEAALAEELAGVSKIAEDWGHCTRALSRLGRVAEIVPLIEKALAQQPDNVDILLPMGNAYSAVERYEDAIEAYRQAIEVDPKNYVVWYEQGYVLSRMKKYEEALISFDTALRLKPRIPANISVMKANTLMHLDRYEEVLRLLRPFLRSGKSIEGVFAMYGGALAELNRHSDAVEYLQKAIESFPDNYFVLAKLGLSLLKTGREDEGLVALRNSAAGDPQNRWIATRYCVALFATRQYQKALEEIPSEIVAHRIFHLLLGIRNNHPKQGELQNRLKSVESMVTDPAWKQAFQGGLTEFVGLAAENTKSNEEIEELETWANALRELFGDQPSYQMIIELVSVLVQFKMGAGLRVLLSLPLEQRRLLVSEKQEQLLGRS
jgi:tetratricopeptide (TPR) repeat protein